MIVMTSIVVGTAAVMIMDSISMGFVYQQLDNQISNFVGHFQINAKGYSDNKVIAKRISNSDEIESALKHFDFVKAYSKRVLSYGMLSSVEGSAGVIMAGINPATESKVTSIKKQIIKGEYIGNNPHDINVSSAIAKKLNVDIDDKIVMMAASADGSVQSELYRIKGIFKSNNNEFDKTHVFVPIKSVQKLLGIGNDITQFVMLTDNTDNIDKYKTELEKVIDGKYEVLSYKDILPLLVFYIQLSIEMMALMYVIIGIAILFGIINTMLMSVFERIQEFGVLMSIGMKSNQIFSMVIQEAFILGVLGTFAGFAVGYLFYLLFAVHGIDLSAFSESLESWGVGSVIYPVIDINVMYRALLIIPATTVIGAVYPAIKAIRLQPTDAMRYI
jgi:ABC-type lipoprotein release transport system permease subunit